MVIDTNSGSERGQPRPNANVHCDNKLPYQLQQLQERGSRHLKKLLQAMFDQADGSLFELADKAHSNNEQTLFFESIRNIHSQRRYIEREFLLNFRNNFSDLVFAPEAVDNDGAEDIDNIDLALVEKDEVEQQVFLDTMVTRAKHNFNDELFQLTARIDLLMGGHCVDDKLNPLGPIKIVDAFCQAGQLLNIENKVKLVFYRLFDRYVMSELDGLYKACNQYLISEGVLTSSSAIKRAKRGRQARAHKVAAGSNATNNATAGVAGQSGFASDTVDCASDMGLQSAPFVSYEGQSNSAQEGTAEFDVFTTFQQLLGPRQTGGDNLGLTNVLSVAALVSFLSSLQQQISQQQVTRTGSYILVRDLVDQNLQASVKGERKNTVNQSDGDVINLVSMLFDFILNDREWAEPLKALIARMQVPMLKVALMDRSFFSKGGHPARRLLNEIANASMGWQGNSDLTIDPFYKKVESIVDQLLNEFDADITTFEKLLADFIAFRDMERRRIQILEKRTIDAEDGKARTDSAKAVVSEMINAYTDGQELPKVVHDLLNDAWSNVMLLICLKDGVDSSAWHSSEQTVIDLVWSVRQDHNAADRKRLMKLIPNLLTRLRRGLESISFNPFEMSILFEKLESIHLESFKRLLQPRDEYSGNSEKTPDLSGSSQLSSSTFKDDESDTLANKELAGKTSGKTSGQLVQKDVRQEDTCGAKTELSQASTATNKTTAAIDAQQPAILSNEPSEQDPVTKQFLVLVDKLTMGTWVEFRENESKHFRCRLAAVIKHSGKYIFVNRCGKKVAEKTRLELASDLSHGTMNLMEDAQLFDQALESVIGNMRRAQGNA